SFNNSFQGSLDELRIWNVVRTASQISDNFKDTISRNTSGLVDYYNFDQGIGNGNNTGLNTLIDIAGTNNGGTLSNMALNGSSSNWVRTYNITVNSPGSLIASQNNCSTIELNWILSSPQPTAFCDASIECEPANFRQQVIADGVMIAEYPFNTTSCVLNVNQIYNGLRLVRGVDYKFYVRTAYVPPLFNFVRYSNVTNPATGRFKPNPLPPSAFTASDNKCDASVDLSWTWTEANPQNGFLIERATDSSFANPLLIPVSADRRSFANIGLLRGVSYLYRIRARNDCFNAGAPDSMWAGESDTIQPVLGISPNPPQRATNIRLFPDSINNVITIRWNDNSDIEDKYTVERSSASGGFASFETNPNDTVYHDDQAAGCVNYFYTVKVFSGCALSGISSVGLNQTRLSPDLSRIFEENSVFRVKGSKGYYSDRIELTWNNRNRGQLSAFRIFRKLASSNSDSTLINIVPASTGLFVDRTAQAGLMYRYFVIGEAQCGGITTFSNITSDIGFRSPAGVITGAISFDGGFAVEGVRVLAQNTSGIRGNSIAFDGVDDYLITPHQSSQDIGKTNAFTIETWFNPMAKRSFVLVSKRDTLEGGYELHYDSASNQLVLHVANATQQQNLVVDSPFFSFSSYNQITAVYGSDSLKLFVNGVLVGANANVIGNIGTPQTPIYFGSNPINGVYGKGYLDEIRMYKIAKTNAQVIQDFNRSIENSNPNLFLYYTFDDKFNGLTETYDQSNLNLVFNENHASLINGSNFSDSVPSNSQLNLAAYTNAFGSYVLNNVRYTGTGQNFTVVPALGIHTFTPNNRVLFIGDGAQVVSNIDFIDNSSFEFTGRVTYAGTTCPASGATVYIDNIPAILNGKQVIVNDSGKFNVQVPIGPHVVSLSMPRHTFSMGSFPPTGNYNFLGPVSANFVDSTFLKVVGRVVGGNRELNKAPGLGRSKNNIGKAQFTLNSTGQQGLSGCFTKQVFTNDTTGEYEIYMLPLRYTINGLRLVNNPDPTLLTKSEFNNPNVLDLTSSPGLVTIYDTLRTDLFSRADSIQFNRRLDFKYYETPEIFLTKVTTSFDSLVNNFIGEEEIVINNSISIPTRDLSYPVFKEGVFYTGKLKVIEQYINIDKDSSDATRRDIVPVMGKFRIFNNLAETDDAFREVITENDFYEYTFRGGGANTLTNSLIPEYSYTKNLQIQFIPNAGLTVEYLPNKIDPNSKFYRGVVFGAEISSSAFTSTGPALVDFVLRDPPGSASSATWSAGKSYTTVDSWNSTNSFTGGFERKLRLGTKVDACVCVLGIGTRKTAEVKNDLTFGLQVGTSISKDGEVVTTTSSNKSLSTGGDPGSVGAGADIYYGKAQNLIFGFTNEVKLIDTATCRILDNTIGSQICFGPEINGHRIGKVNGMFLVPGSVATTFAYTQNEILDIIIPDLELLRNNLLISGALNARGQRKYTPIFNDPNDLDFARKFGSNNDDPIWGEARSTNTPFVRELQDTFGASYLFWPGYKFEADSIRYYNTQIQLWKKAIARNEEEKFKSLSRVAALGGSNISIGKAVYTEDFSSQVDQTYTESYELTFGQELAIAFGFAANNTGFQNTLTASFEQVRGKSKSSTTSAVNTFGYTLQDGDDGDLITVDIVDPKSGNGHVFKLKAGRTSCPYEGEQRSLFYDPNNDTITATTLLEEGVILQNATAQNDKPVISVQQSSIFNIPSEEEAVFVLELGNLSEGRQDRTYALKINEASNPFGAIIKVDGLSPNREFDVPFGTTLQKTLTLKRGPLNYDYDNIQLILSSPCDGDIFDTVSISAKFLPTCTGVNLKSPDDRWVLNNSF
ncbi:MAG: LamG-like jellyroll fold domain-containing protein, partial [Bacteroidota bacterium]|nr:LamG-like jellyroll fold domain-containing protein [Bacteroidota bacterium]